MIECAAHTGTSVTLDGSASLDPGGENLVLTWEGPFGRRSGETIDVNLPVGAHTVTLTAVDETGHSAMDNLTVKIQDTTPPDLKIVLSPGLLWPPDHSLVEVKSGVRVADTCDSSPSVLLTSISSSEADRDLGDGDTPGDIQECDPGIDDRTFKLSRREVRNRQGQNLHCGVRGQRCFPEFTESLREGDCPYRQAWQSCQSR